LDWTIRLTFINLPGRQKGRAFFKEGFQTKLRLFKGGGFLLFGRKVVTFTLEKGGV